MTVVFQGEVFVSYSQAYVQVEGADLPDMATMFQGQANGLCGAVVPDSLFLVTGLHTGAVPFIVEVFADEPPVPEEWQDVVEVSFSASESEVMLLGWGGMSSDWIFLGQPGWFRVRYCAMDFAAGRQSDTRIAGTDVLDRYLLQFWPAASEPDAVVRVSGPETAYWHEYAAALPPPPTADELAAADELRRREASAQRERDETAAMAWQWGGRVPSPRLQSLGGNVRGVARTDRDLLDVFEALDADLQRDTAHWLARRAFEIAEIDQLDWVVPALAAMDRGDPLPAPFTDPSAVHAVLRPTGEGRTAAMSFTVRRTRSDERRPVVHAQIHRPSFAVPAIFSATDADPLQALVDTFSHAAATFNEHRARLVTELVERIAP